MEDYFDDFTDRFYYYINVCFSNRYIRAVEKLLAVSERGEL